MLLPAKPSFSRVSKGAAAFLRHQSFTLRYRSWTAGIGVSRATLTAAAGLCARPDAPHRAAGLPCSS